MQVISSDSDELTGDLHPRCTEVTILDNNGIFHGQNSVNMNSHEPSAQALYIYSVPF